MAFPIRATETPHTCRFVLSSRQEDKHILFNFTHFTLALDLIWLAIAPYIDKRVSSR